MPLTRTEFKDLKSLQTRKGRDEQQEFMAEGVRVLEEADRHGVQPRVCCGVPDLLRERGRRLWARWESAGVRMEAVSTSQLKAITDAKTPQPLVGIFRLVRETDDPAALDRWSAARPGRVLICDGIADPGNLGTLLRSAAAFGFPAVALVNTCADPYGPKVVRSTAGALFAVEPVVVEVDTLIEWLKEGRYVLVAATSQRGAEAVHAAALGAARRVAVAIGSESSGVSQGLLENAAHRWRIAHSAKVESLNAAVAGSIVLWEVARCIQ